MKRLATIPLSLLLLALLVPGCPAQRRALSREALLKSLEELDTRTAPLPSLAEVQALRIPAPAEVPAALRARAEAAKKEPARFSPLERARLAIAVSGDVEAAEAAWREAASGDDETRQDALLHRCLVEESLRRYPEMIEACAGFLDAAPEEPEAAAVVLLLARSRSATERIDRLLSERASAWLEGCRARNEDGGSCADLAWVLGSAAADARGHEKDEAGAKAAIAARGALTSARISGPYDEADRFAFGLEGEEVELIPIEGRTFESERFAWDGRFAPAERGAKGLYKLVFDVEGGGDATLYVTGRHALRVVVDGAPVLERRPLLRDEANVSRVGLRLVPGAHRVEVLAQSFGPGDGIGLSVLDGEGRPALRPRVAREAKSAGAQRVPLVGASQASGAAAKGEDLVALDARLLAASLGRSGFGVTASGYREEARALLATWGFAPQALVTAASAVGDDDTVPERFAYADAAPLWQRLEQIWPAHPVARITRARALREERPEEALGAYRALVKEHPGYPFGQRELVRLALERGLVGEAYTAARTLLDQERSRENLDAAIPALERAGHVAEAARLERQRARLDDALYGEGWARWLLGAGRTDEALVELTRLCDAVPGHPAEGLLLDLLSLSRPADALARTERLIARFPNDREALARHISLVGHLEGNEAALALAMGALERFGADGDLHLLVEELGGAPVWLPRLAAGDQAIAARRAATEEPFPGHPIVMLVDHMERHVMADLSSIEVRHWLVELKSEDSLDSFGELRVSPRDRLLRLRVIKPDGRVLEPEHPPGVEDVSLTGLGLGDLVEMLTVSYAGPPNTGGIAFESFRFSSRAPALERSYLLTAPKALLADERFRVLRRGAAPEPVRKEQDDRTALLFSARDVPARFDEPHATAEEEHGDLAGYAWSTDAAHWALWRGRAIALGARAEPWLEEAARRIAGEGEPGERFARLFRFVTGEIEPGGGPRGAAGALATGRGERAPLLLALARAAGLDADAVAVHVPIAAPLEVPTTNAFSTLGVRASLPGGPSYAFVEEQLAVLDGLPPLAKGASVLALTLDEEPSERLAKLPDTAVSSRPVKVQVDLEYKAPDKLEGFLALTIPAYLAEPVRRGMRQASSAQLKALFEQALGDSLPGVRAVEVTLPQLDAPGRPLGVGVALEVPLRRDGVDPVRFERLFSQGASGSLGLFTPLSSYLRVAERKEPLLVVAAEEELELELSLPPGGAFVEAPERYEASAGPFTLTQRAAVTDGTLFWSRRLTARTERVGPAEWQALRAALTSLSGRTEARVAFVLPSG